MIGTDADQDFTAFWAAYPRKIGKGAARKAYRSAVIGKRTDPKKITLAGEAFRDECKRLGTEMKFIPHPATWLNAERYDDEAHEASGATGYSYSPWEN